MSILACADSSNFILLVCATRFSPLYQWFLPNRSSKYPHTCHGLIKVAPLTNLQLVPSNSSHCLPFLLYPGCCWKRDRGSCYCFFQGDLECWALSNWSLGGKKHWHRLKATALSFFVAQQNSYLILLVHFIVSICPVKLIYCTFSQFWFLLLQGSNTPIYQIRNVQNIIYMNTYLPWIKNMYLFKVLSP